MSDAQLLALAGRQFNRISRQQLIELGLTESVIARRVATGRLVAVEEGVFAIAPLLDDDWGRWMGATLTAPGTVLSHASAAAAWGFWSLERPVEIVTRAGSGGPRRIGGLLVYRNSTLAGWCESVRGVPITSVARTVVDLSAGIGERMLARVVREAIMNKLTTVAELYEARLEHHGRRGIRRLEAVLSRYSGLPLHRARSGAEVRALEILRAAGGPMPRLNVRIAGEEADLSWPEHRLIVEIDGGPFHLDRGEDARKQRVWEAAGWTVRRVSSEDVYERPYLLRALAPAPETPDSSPPIAFSEPWESPAHSMVSRP